MKFTTKNSLNYIGLVLLLLLTGATIFLYINKILPKQQHQSASVQSPLTDSSLYQNAQLGFSILYTPDLAVELNGESSILLVPINQEPGPGPTNYIYISIADIRESSEPGSVYNYSSKLFEESDTINFGDSITVADAEQPEFDQWFTYQLSEVVSIDGNHAKVFNNYQPWEFPNGTTETRYIFEKDGTRYILGYYTGGDSVTVSALDPRIAKAIVESFSIIEPEKVSSSHSEKFEELLANKYPDLDLSTQLVIVDVQQGDFVSGRLEPKNSPVGGGYFYAAKNDQGIWEIAAAGNGAIMCEDIAPYNFPSSMISECYDKVSDQAIHR